MNRTKTQSARGALGIIMACLVLAAGCANDGSNGASCSVSQDDDGSATIACDDGTSAKIEPGRDGRDGADGKDGMPGAAGTSCSVSDSDAGVLVRCDDGSEAVVPPGPAGQDGQPGTPGPAGPTFRAAATGLSIEVLEATLDADRRVSVRLRMHDANGIALDRTGEFTEGSVSASFTLSAMDESGDLVGPYVSYLNREVTSNINGSKAIQPFAESGGTWESVDPATGEYRYSFEALLPEDYVASDTHLVAVYATRSFAGVRYVDNPTLRFRPDGSSDAAAGRYVSDTLTCNGCHDPISAHGGSRQEYQLCLSCHTQGATDPDTFNSIDFGVMVHKIHRGADLPSVKSGTPYQIIGYRDHVYDYSTVKFPQDVRNCTTCHSGVDGDRLDSNPTGESCGSCHDDIWFGDVPSTPPDMVPHSAGEQPDDSRCANCHGPGRANSATNKHKTVHNDPDAPQLTVSILDVTTANNAAASQVRLQAYWNLNSEPCEPTDSGNFDPAGPCRPIAALGDLSRLDAFVAGPNEEYARRASSTNPDAPSFEWALDALSNVTVEDANLGIHTFELPETIDAIATDLGADVDAASFTLTLTAGFSDGTYTHYAKSPAAAFTAAVGDATARRQLVDTDKCNSCHMDLGLHGGRQTSVEQCNACHVSSFDTLGRQPAPGAGMTAPTTSLHLSNLVHRVHGYPTAQGPYTVYSYSGNTLDLSKVRYPGAAQNCDTCHVDDAQYLPLASSALPSEKTIIDESGAVVDTLITPPTAAACTSCHDGAEAAAHAATNTAADGTEACTTCHGNGASAGVDLVHARPEHE